jgi:hypothetical protein
MNQKTLNQPDLQMSKGEMKRKTRHCTKKKKERKPDLERGAHTGKPMLIGERTSISAVISNN